MSAEACMIYRLLTVLYRHRTDHSLRFSLSKRQGHAAQPFEDQSPDCKLAGMPIPGSPRVALKYGTVLLDQSRE
jgi:hypothetical protein